MAFREPGHMVNRLVGHAEPVPLLARRLHECGIGRRGGDDARLAHAACPKLGSNHWGTGSGTVMSLIEASNSMRNAIGLPRRC